MPVSTAEVLLRVPPEERAALLDEAPANDWGQMDVRRALRGRRAEAPPPTRQWGELPTLTAAPTWLTGVVRLVSVAGAEGVPSAAQSVRAVALSDRPQARVASEPRKGDETTDYDRLVAALRTLAPSVRKSSDRVCEPAVRVIECVLSLNRRYDSFVVPRLDRFERAHSGIRTVSDLQALVATYASPARFLSAALDYRDPARAATLTAVVDWLVTVGGNGDYDKQLSNLQLWATEAQPADYGTLRIDGFGLGGFQYLRMLFGADTTKPDIHIRRYVESCVEHSVSDVQALRLLEYAAQKVGTTLVDLDTTIWELSARGA